MGTVVVCECMLRLYIGDPQTMGRAIGTPIASLRNPVSEHTPMKHEPLSKNPSFFFETTKNPSLISKLLSSLYFLFQLLIHSSSFLFHSKENDHNCNRCAPDSAPTQKSLA